LHIAILDFNFGLKDAIWYRRNFSTASLKSQTFASSQNFQEIADVLEADHIHEGSVRKADKK
jgi:hypothetical protein